ncbi:type I restriction modification DNA specificity domain protein [Eubacterium sulci ATCC 35585]|nr:type I restriction modification DNA specificity domain protein [Eubacterium sulci ATCC 35585]
MGVINMTENRKTPKLRFKGFTDAWEQRKLGEIFEEYSVKNHEELPALMIIQGCGTIRRDESERSLLYDKANLSNYKMVNEGDFIVHLRSFEGGLEMATNIGIISPAYHTFHGENTDSRFYYSYFRSKKFIDIDLKPHVYGIRDGRSVDVEGMKTVKIPFTSYDEQKAIGMYIKRFDNLITLHQRKLERLKNVKKSMLDKMFPKDGEVVPEIRFKGFTDAWEQRKLGDIGTITTGSTPSTSIPDYYSDDGIIWVTPTDISENITFKSARKLSELGQQVGRVVPKNTILVTCIASIGKNTMLGNTGSFNQQINGLTPNENKYEPYFLLIESEIWSAQMRKSAAAGTMQIINRTEFSGLETWIPKLNEQKVIGTYFRNLDNLITLHQRKLDKLKNIKKSMLDNMFV